MLSNELKTKKTNLSISLFVITEGFKPPTAGAEIQCSIQLSYVTLFAIAKV